MTAQRSSLPPFGELRPDLLKEWNTEKNGALDPKSFSAGSTQKVWWRCITDPRHEWEAVIGNRARKGKGCPFCVGQRTLPDETFAVLYPKQFREWHPTKNAHLDPTVLSPSSQERVWWQCSNDPSHEWDTMLFVRTKRGDKGCPYCAGRRASAKNSLATVFPSIAAEWHPTKNGNLTPRDVTAKNHRRVWWKCKTCLFEWQTAINMRTINKSNCPLCSRDAGAIGSKRTKLEKQEASEATYDFDTDDTLVFDYRAIQSLLTARVKVTSELKKIESALGARLVSRTNYQPYYQRNYIWDIEKQTYFMESVLIGTEVPPLIFYEQSGGFEVIDGRQRFETLLRFQNNQLALSAKALTVRKDLAQKRFRDLNPQDRDAFLDSKLRLIQFAVVDSAAVSERAQDMLKKEIFRRYNSGITPLRQVEVDRAIYIADEPTQFIREKLRNNPSLYEMFGSLFLSGGNEGPEPNPTNLEKALQEVRFLLVCAQMPILSTRKKESLQRFYEWYSETHEDAHAIYRDFLKHVQLVDKLRARALEAGWAVSRLWNQVMYWAAAVLEREGEDSNRLLDEVTSTKLIEIYAQNEQAYAPGESQFLYGQFLYRYATASDFLEREFGVSLGSYLRKRDRVEKTVAVPSSMEDDDSQVFSRIEKQDPTSLNVEDICNDIKRSIFMLRPSYQRGEVINRSKSSGIIESILLGIKLPPLYIFRRIDGVSEVIDGQQRILSILGFVGQPFLNENNEQVFSEKNGFQLSRLRILDHLNGKTFRDLEPSQQERIWDFGLSIIAIEERFNPGFSPVDLFIRLNSRPYPIKENTFEMWNSYVDKEIIDLIKQTTSRCSNWFYRTRQNDRMTNEELVSLLSYLAYTQVARNGNHSSMESVIDVFRRSSGINVRVKQKAAVTRVLDNATAVPATKEDVIEAIKKTDSFIRKIRTLLIDKDVDDVDEYLNAQLTRLFNVADKRYYVRKLKDFYALWYITYELGTEIVVRKRAEIRADIDNLFRLMLEETPDEENDTTTFLARVEVFKRKYATADRRLKLTDQEKREMIRRQGNKCPICGDQLFIHDDIEVDHIVPIGVQGADDHDNLQVAHKICNRKKGVAG